MNPLILNGTWQYYPLTSEDTPFDIQNLPDISFWQTMTLPQNWYLAGLEHEGVVWFRREFEMSANDECSVWWLEFSGVDYRCEVWLNHIRLGGHEGYFGKFRFDATEAVHMGMNVLVVKVESPRDPGWPMTKQLIKGVLHHHDCRPGGAWSAEGQSRNTGGIWGNVILHPYPCDNAPGADDWYQPLEKPRIHRNPDTQTWTRISSHTPFFIRGTNYIPSQYLSELSRADFERDIRLMKAAHLNTVRVHAHILPDVFYQLCDEMDMQVWQDFPLQWGYSDSAEFHAEALRQVEEMVRQLGHHPCIAVWCVHNGSPGNNPWIANKAGIDHNPDQNRELDKKLAARIRELDPHRHVVENSGTQETHIYAGWYQGSWRDYAHIESHPLPLEYGAQALPNLESMQKILPADALDYNTREAQRQWAYHNFQHEQTFEIARLLWKKDESLESFIKKSQDYQARLIKYATENFRLQKGNPIQGIFQFMLVDCWPSISWSVLDYWRNPKEGYRALTDAMRPVLPIAAIPLDYVPHPPTNQEIKFPLMIVNDLPEDLNHWNLKFSVTAWRPSTESITEQTFMHHWYHTYKNLDIKACSLYSLGNITLPPFTDEPMDYHLVLQLFTLDDEQQETVVNSYVLTVK